MSYLRMMLIEDRLRFNHYTRYTNFDTLFSIAMKLFGISMIDTGISYQNNIKYQSKQISGHELNFICIIHKYSFRDFNDIIFHQKLNTYSSFKTSYN